MASKDSGGQDRTTKRSEETDEVAVADTGDVQDRVGKLTDEVDALLDDIDDVLESNAEDFVKGFVQKGGE